MKKEMICHPDEEKQKQPQWRYFILLLPLAAVLLRTVLVRWLLPQGEVLEALAFFVQQGELPVAQAVATFCREVVISGA